MNRDHENNENENNENENNESKIVVHVIVFQFISD